jgi:hypothetical protein
VQALLEVIPFGGSLEVRGPQLQALGDLASRAGLPLYVVEHTSDFLRSRVRRWPGLEVALDGDERQFEAFIAAT